MSDDITIIDGVIEEIQYEPTKTQREIKKKFWSKFKSSPGYSPGSVPSRAVIQRIVKNQASTIYKKWDTPGFKEWFLNDNAFEETLYEHEHSMLFDLIDIAKNTEAKDSDRLKAIGMYFEMSGRFKKKAPEIKYMDASINSMSEDQIKAELQKARLKSDKSETD